MSQSRDSLEQIFQAHIQTLALTLRRDTVTNHRCVAHRFPGYLQAAFPRVRRFAQLRRDPHLLGWFRWMCEQDPPLCNETRGDYLLGLRRWLDDLAANGHSIQPDLIRREDFPPRPQYLPRPLPPQDDQLLRQQLRRTDDLPANALLLTRATGIRIGECIDLALDCLRQIGPDQWAPHVPFGKLHTERLVPADDDVQWIVARILALRALASPARLAKSGGFLPPRFGGHYALYQTLSLALADAAKRAGCSCAVTPAPAQAHLRLGDAPSRCQPSRSDAVARPRRHPHDFALCAGHPAGLITRVPLRPPACGAIASGPCTLRSQLRRQRRSPRHPSGPRCHTPSSGDLPPGAPR